MKPLAAAKQRIGTVALAPDEAPVAGRRSRPGRSPALRIGGWCIDRATNEIARGAERVHLEPKVMDVLMALAAEPGAVFSREQLLAAAWPGMVVGDEALTQSIIKLRRALGDNPRAPAYIETIPKRGYRLIADVTHDEAVPPRADPGSAATTATARAAAGTANGDAAAINGIGDAAPTANGEAAPTAYDDAPPAAGGDAAPAPAAPVHRPRGSLAAALAVMLVVAVAAALYAAVPRLTPSSPSTAPASGPPAGADDASGLPTVTVLPFETVGAGTEQAYLAQGIGSDP
jgi:DNA-binding winged helix-turn-helix (wHTH) protein